MKKTPEGEEALRTPGRARDFSDALPGDDETVEGRAWKGGREGENISFEEARQGYHTIRSVDNQFGVNSLNTFGDRAQTPKAKDHITSLKDNIRLFNMQQAMLKSNIHMQMSPEGRVLDPKSGKSMDSFKDGEEGSRTWWEGKRNQTLHSVMQHIDELSPENEAFNSSDFPSVNDHDIMHEHNFSPKQAWHMSPNGSSDSEALKEGVRRGFNVTPNGL